MAYALYLGQCALLNKIHGLVFIFKEIMQAIKIPEIRQCVRAFNRNLYFAPSFRIITPAENAEVNAAIINKMREEYLFHIINRHAPFSICAACYADEYFP